MFKQLKKYWRNLMLAAKYFEQERETARLDNTRMRGDIRRLTDVIQSRTKISADIGFSSKGMSYVVMCGRYKNIDYVETVSIRNEDFEYFVGMLKDMSKFGTVEFVDAPPSFRSIIKRELKE